MSKLHLEKVLFLVSMACIFNNSRATVRKKYVKYLVKIVKGNVPYGLEQQETAIWECFFPLLQVKQSGFAENGYRAEFTSDIVFSATGVIGIDDQLLIQSNGCFLIKSERTDWRVMSDE